MAAEIGSIGSVSVRVVPDMTDFQRVLAEVAEQGTLTLVEVTDFVYDGDGRIVQQTVTKTIRSPFP